MIFSVLGYCGRVFYFSATSQVFKRCQRTRLWNVINGQIQDRQDIGWTGGQGQGLLRQSAPGLCGAPAWSRFQRWLTGAQEGSRLEKSPSLLISSSSRSSGQTDRKAVRNTGRPFPGTRSPQTKTIRGILFISLSHKGKVLKLLKKDRDYFR